MSRQRTTFQFSINHKKRYGFWAFMGDMFMIIMTGGLWLIWMVIRHVRNI